MNKKKLILAAFILVALIQVYIPVKMILVREDVLSTGKEYKFRTEPIDPTDPFRGKYVVLDYEISRYKMRMLASEEWGKKEEIYVLLSTDKEGFASIHSVSETEPEGDIDFVKAKVSYMSGNDELRIEYPFTRFYMEESKAPIAEEMYWDSNRDNRQEAYALINVKDGEAVLKDVMIKGVSLRELAKRPN